MLLHPAGHASHVSSSLSGFSIKVPRGQLLQLVLPFLFSKAEKNAARLAKPEKLKTRREALLGELYSHAMSPKFVETYCDTVNKEMEQQEQQKRFVLM